MLSKQETPQQGADFFEYLSRWDVNHSFCYKKEKPIKVISFDMFDTLVVRPVGRCTDVFELLDHYFQQKSRAMTSFKLLRMEAEAVLRRRIIHGTLDQEDLSIHEVYEVLVKEFGLDQELADFMKQKELDLECKLCHPRKKGKELYERAIATGLPVIIVSDMYLTKEHLAHMLEINGYTGYAGLFVSCTEGCRKITGRLYTHVADKMNVAPEEILHIGDNRDSDCEIPGKLGYQTLWVPGTRDMYEQHGCGTQVRKICTDLTNWEAAESSVGIGALKQMAANLYFDDPFREFAAESDYNADPYFVGYGALGMEILALNCWLVDQVDRDQADKLIFMARDGYMPIKAYEIQKKYHPDWPKAEYLPVSRRSVLPALFRAPEDFYDLPVDLNYQSPGKLVHLLDFCCEGPGKLYERFPENEALDRGEYHRFIHAFLTECYDGKKHADAVAHVGDYLLHNKQAPLTENCAMFDMGYSGQIPAAISNATGLTPKIYYLHSDAREHFRRERRTGLKIRSFFDFSPYMEAAIREYSYLEAAASCIGYDENLQPLYDIGPAKGYADAALKMQQGALDFIRDFYEFFGAFPMEAGFRYHEAAMPFEAFIRYCSVYDRQIYDKVLFDDELWGGRRDIDMKYLMEARLRKIPSYAKESDHE